MEFFLSFHLLVVVFFLFPFLFRVLVAACLPHSAEKERERERGKERERGERRSLRQIATQESEEEMGGRGKRKRRGTRREISELV